VKVKHDAKAHFEQCAELTGAAAEIASRIILESKPHLAKMADLEHLTAKGSMLMGTLNRIYPGVGVSFPRIFILAPLYGYDEAVSRANLESPVQV
jgi:hypothetical protein